MMVMTLSLAGKLVAFVAVGEAAVGIEVAGDMVVAVLAAVALAASLGA